MASEEQERSRDGLVHEAESQSSQDLVGDETAAVAVDVRYRLEDLWGIVPSSDEAIEKETVESLVARMESVFDKMEEKGINRQKAAVQSLITPQCGLGLVAEENVDKVLDLLKGVSETLKQRYGLQ